MSKRYESADDQVAGYIKHLREHYYTDLEPVQISALFVADESGKPCLSHQGYPAAALCRIVPARDRASGLPDAQIIIDAAVWEGLSKKQRTALLDHEMHHVEPVRDDAGDYKRDAQNRPKLQIRKHDWHLGWFDQVAQRHGNDSLEVMTARHLIEQSGQLYFDFTKAAA